MKELFGIGQGNHLPKLRAMLAAYPGCDLLVHHDEDCGIFAAGFCNCDPDVVVDQVDTAAS